MNNYTDFLLIWERKIPMGDQHNRTWMPRKGQRIKLAAFLIFMAILAALLVVRLNKPSSSFTENLQAQMTYEVINTYPHDPSAFTQGLVYHDGFLYESTGLYGESTLRKVELETGEILQLFDVPEDYFGEGLTLWQGTLLQLTWREGTGFIYDLDDFSLIDQFSYSMEGWGLTHDGERLIMSDGTSRLFFLDPDSHQVIGSVDVTYQGEGVQQLNELEFIHGEVYANIWQTDQIVRINPGTGEVVGWIDLTGILPAGMRTAGTDVLNGIAFDPGDDRLFVTGKLWPTLYEIRLIPKQ